MKETIFWKTWWKCKVYELNEYNQHGVILVKFDISFYDLFNIFHSERFGSVILTFNDICSAIRYDDSLAFTIVLSSLCLWQKLLNASVKIL